MIYGSVFHSSIDLYEEVAGYETMAHCLHALQLILHEKARGTIAQHMAVAAIYLLQESIGGMPDDVAEGWGKYAKLDALELKARVRRIDVSGT